MSEITLTTWGHAGIRLERDGHRLVIDPGSFTDPAVLDGPKRCSSLTNIQTISTSSG
ncbi:MAG: hypothetical protein ACLGHX_08665 [Acidimicrobiia bacterium]